MPIKKLYEALLEDGALNDVLEDATGDWLKDKKKFKEYYNQNQQYIQDIEIADFEDYSE